MQRFCAFLHSLVPAFAHAKWSATFICSFCHPRLAPVDEDALGQTVLTCDPSCHPPDHLHRRSLRRRLPLVLSVVLPPLVSRCWDTLSKSGSVPARHLLCVSFEGRVDALLDPLAGWLLRVDRKLEDVSTYGNCPLVSVATWWHRRSLRP